MKLTRPQRRALELIQEHESVYPAQLARLMWPDSPGWNKRSRRSSTPAGGAMGATMPMKAGTLLHRLWRMGLVRLRKRMHAYEYSLTRDGKRALEEQ